MSASHENKQNDKDMPLPQTSEQLAFDVADSLPEQHDQGVEAVSGSIGVAAVENSTDVAADERAKQHARMHIVANSLLPNKGVGRDLTEQEAVQIERLQDAGQSNLYSAYIAVTGLTPTQFNGDAGFNFTTDAELEIVSRIVSETLPSRLKGLLMSVTRMAAQVDPATHQRIYSDEQIEQLLRLIELKKARLKKN